MSLTEADRKAGWLGSERQLLTVSTALAWYYWLGPPRPVGSRRSLGAVWEVRGGHQGVLPVCYTSQTPVQTSTRTTSTPSPTSTSPSSPHYRSDQVRGWTGQLWAPALPVWIIVSNETDPEAAIICQYSSLTSRRQLKYFMRSNFLFFFLKIIAAQTAALKSYL